MFTESGICANLQREVKVHCRFHQSINPIRMYTFNIHDCDFGCRDSSFGIATGYGAHPASYPLDTGVTLLGGKAIGAWSHHAPSSGAEVKNSGVIPPLPHTYSWRIASVTTQKENFTFLPDEQLCQTCYFSILLNLWFLWLWSEWPSGL
jgi:hypothetical protein